MCCPHVKLDLAFPMPGVSVLPWVLYREEQALGLFYRVLSARRTSQAPASSK